MTQYHKPGVNSSLLTKSRLLLEIKFYFIGSQLWVILPLQGPLAVYFLLSQLEDIAGV